MMEYPQEVQKIIDILKKYEVNKELEEFDILHIYPKELAFPNGYCDSRFFDVVFFNTKKMEKREICHKDSLDWAGVGNVKMIRVFADGGVLVKFKNFQKISYPDTKH
jgi:hypothetical protein